MLLFLAEYLTRFESGFQVFQYLTLRGILAAVPPSPFRCWSARR